MTQEDDLHRCTVAVNSTHANENKSSEVLVGVTFDSGRASCR